MRKTAGFEKDGQHFEKKSKNFERNG